MKRILISGILFAAFIVPPLAYAKTPDAAPAPQPPTAHNALKHKAPDMPHKKLHHPKGPEALKAPAQGLHHKNGAAKHKKPRHHKGPEALKDPAQELHHKNGPAKHKKAHHHKGPEALPNQGT